MTREEINEEQQKKISRENNLESTKKWIIFSIKWLLIVSVIVILFVSYTTYISSVIVEVREYRIINSKIPKSLDGIKILQFSDLHYGSTMLEENLEQVKEIINDRKPDIILFTGDLISQDYKMSSEEKEKLSSVLKEMYSTLGKYAVLGDEDNPELATLFNQGDFISLSNDYDLIYNDDTNPILLIGLSSLLGNTQDIDQGFSYFSQESFNAEIFSIVMTHEPDVADDIVNSYSNTDLILAGHSHNGSVRTPINNIPVDRKKGAYKYNNEQYTLGNTQLYISGGLGTSGTFAFRLFCRPSINLYRLSSE